MSEIRVNNVIGEDGGTPVNFTKGINITSGVVTATTFKGNVTGDVTGSSTGLSGTPNITVGAITGTTATFSGNVSVGATLTYEDVTNIDSVGIVTAGAGLKVTTGGANIVGVTTSSITALDAISEQLVRVDGNTATITYNSGGANIGYCTNPTGDITLSVTGIPTSSFDNQALTFSLIVDNSTAAAAGVRTCNAVKLNNVTKTIRWSGGSVGTGNTAAYDIFNFTGINTVGSGTATANYEVFGLVNGDFRLY